MASPAACSDGSVGKSVAEWLSFVMVQRAVVMRIAVKALLNLLATTIVLPFAIGCRISCKVFGDSDGFSGWSEAMALIPGLTGQYLRRAFYRSVLDRCGEGVAITFGTTFSSRKVKLGNNVYIGKNCTIGSINIEDDVLIASNVSIMNGSEQHGTSRLDIPIRLQPGFFAPETIARDCWIGERAVIAADLGAQSIIGAGSVVTKPIPSRAIAVGTPAKVLRLRDEDSVRDLQSEHAAVVGHVRELVST